MHYYGVLNGEVGTVLNFTEHPDEFGCGVFTVLVNKADGSKRVVAINTKENTYPARFKHGYAVTGYKLQGDTATHMMVYHEPVIGYEAFNVLMTRHRDSVRLYLDEETLEDIVYGKVGNNAHGTRESNAQEARVKYARAKYDIEAYKLNSGMGSQGEIGYEYEDAEDEYGSTSKSNKTKVSTKAPTKVPAWRIGLAMAVSRRVNNSFSTDYIANKTLTEDQRVIKSYLESRELTFALKTKLDEWKTKESTPAKLVLLTKLTGLKLQRHNINPYSLIFTAKDLDGQEGLSTIKSDKPIKPGRNQLIWSNLSDLAKEELKAIFDELMEAKDSLATHARLICANYHSSLDKQQSHLTMGDLLVQLNLSYEPIERHAGYSDYRYYLKEKDDKADRATNEALASNPQFRSIISIFETISNNDLSISRNDERVSEDEKAQIITNIQNNHEILSESINDTRLKLLKTKEELAVFNKQGTAIKNEIEKLATFTSLLFPEYLSRIYKESPNEVIAKWDSLIQENGGKDGVLLSSLASHVYKNPKLLGNLKGIGFGDILGITEERQNAIANLEVISKRLKTYETGKNRLAELNEHIKSNDYKELTKAIISKAGEVKLLEGLLPNKCEENLLSELTGILLSSTKAENNSTSTAQLYNELTHLSKQDDTQNLIYESYNNRGSKQTNKFGSERYGYGQIDKLGSKRQYNSNLTWEKVNSHLTSSHYEQIFRTLAHEINEVTWQHFSGQIST